MNDRQGGEIRLACLSFYYYYTIAHYTHFDGVNEHRS